ncbi:MAG TPA: hypothetical protein VFG50_07355, partial [Rhodothermales bacterium]|nr:hypothetical protein [Rhodothermales bacterium]
MILIQVGGHLNPKSAIKNPKSKAEHLGTVFVRKREKCQTLTFAEMRIPRRNSRAVHVGPVQIGGGA